MGANDVNLTVTAEDSGASATLNQVNDVAQRGARRTQEVIAEASAAEVEAEQAVAEELRAAAEAVEAFGVAATRGGRESAEALDRAKTSVAALETAVDKLGPGQPIEALRRRIAALSDSIGAGAGLAGRLDAATQAAARLDKAAFEGQGRGLTKGLTQARFLAAELAEELKRVEDVGGPGADELRAKIEQLNRSIANGEAAAGRYAKAQKDTEDALRRTTRAAGEQEGQFRSLEDVVNAINPRMGGMVVQFGAAGIVMAILQQVSAQVGAALSSLGQVVGLTAEQGAELETQIKSLTDLGGLAKTVFKDTEPLRLYGKELLGIGDAVSRLSASDRQAIDLLRGNEAQINKNREALERQAKALLATGPLTLDLADALVHQTTKTIEAYERLGQRAPASLLALREELLHAEAAAAGLASTSEIFKRFGVESAASIEESVHALRRFRDELGAGLNVEQLARIEEQAKKLAAALNVLPEDERQRLLSAIGSEAEGLLEVADAGLVVVDAKLRLQRADAEVNETRIESIQHLEEESVHLLGLAENVARAGGATAEFAAVLRDDAAGMIAAYEKLGLAAPDALLALRDGMQAIVTSSVAMLESGEEILERFGVQTPAAILESVAALRRLEEEFTRGGSANAEQAKKIHDEALKIAESIALLPEAQRVALAQQEAYAKSLVATYQDTSKAVKKASEEEVKAQAAALAAEQKITAERIAAQKKLQEAFLATFQTLRNAIPADSSADELKALKEELAGLEAKGLVTPEEQSRVDELRDKIRDASVATSDLSRELFVLGDSSRAGVAGTEQVDAALTSLLDTLRSSPEAWNALSAANKEAIQNIIAGLQSAGQNGVATQRYIQDAFRNVARILGESGGQASELALQLDRAAGGTLNLKNEFAALDTASATAAKGVGGVNASTKETTASLTALGKAGDAALAKVLEGADGVVDRLGTIQSLADQIAATLGSWGDAI